MEAHRVAIWILALALAAMAVAYGYAAAMYKPHYRVYYTYVLTGQAPTTAVSLAPASGKLLAAGTISLEPYSRDYIAMIDRNGIIAWSRSVIHSGEKEYGSQVLAAPEGYYLVSHVLAGNRSIALVTLLDGQGHVLWSREVDAEPPLLAARAPGGIYLVAHAEVMGMRLPIVVRLTSRGDAVWARTLRLTSYMGAPVKLANLSSITVYGVSGDGGGGLLLAGTISDQLHGIYLGFTARLSPSGEAAWAKAVASPDQPTPQGVTASHGTVYLAGLSDSPGGDRYAWLMALNTSDPWVATLNGSGADVLRRLIAVNGTVYAVGYTSSPPAVGEDILLVAFRGGEPLWETCIGGGGNDFGTDIALVNGTVAVSGVAQLVEEYGGLVAFIPPGGLRGSTEAYRPCTLKPVETRLAAVPAGIEAVPLDLEPREARPRVEDIYLTTTLLVRHPVRVYGYRPGWERIALGVLPAAIFIDAALIALILAARALRGGGARRSRAKRRAGKKASRRR